MDSTFLRISGIEDLKARVGQELGVSDWREVTQQDIDDYARVTGDDQWLHVDPERAKNSQWGGTIAHGYFTLSLGARFSYDMFAVDGIAYSLNYGLGKVRFPAPLHVNSKVRMRCVLSEVIDRPGGVQATFTQTFETEAGAKPVCVAEKISRYYVS
jgi:acyl dehydratase